MFDPLAPMRHINLLSALLMRLITALWPRAMRGAPPAPVRWCLARYQAALVAAIHARCAQAGLAAPDMPDAELIKWFVAGPFGRAGACARAGVIPERRRAAVTLDLILGGLRRPLNALPAPRTDAAYGVAPLRHDGGVFQRARGPPCAQNAVITAPLWTAGLQARMSLPQMSQPQIAGLEARGPG